MNDETVEFKNMTNAELKEACIDFGLEVKAKNPGKPNKDEYLVALNEFKAVQDKLHGVETPTEEEVEVKEIKPSGSKRKPQSKAVLVKLDLFMKERVIVHDQQEAQTKDEMVSVSWGNRLTGGQTDWVDLSGEPQYIRRGAIQNLRDAKMVAHIAKPNGGVSTAIKKRFVIQSVDGLTENEMADLRNVQKMRNSKMA